jgi:hypothetical protein
VKRIGPDRRVVKIARDLGLDAEHNVVEQVIDYCLRSIDSWPGIKKISTITELEHLACKRLDLELEEIHVDADIERLVRKYAAEGEYGFATIRSGFDEETFGTTYSRVNVIPGMTKRYVAFIDCRGEKYHRRFFTRWHEIAHLLTNPPKAGQPVNRSTIARCPVEQLMDKIAGIVGFYDPIFRQALNSHAHESLTLEQVETIRLTYCPVASFQATLITCIQRVDEPAIYVEVGLGYKKAEGKKVYSDQMSFLPDDLPESKLRVLQASPNTAARTARIRIDRNMEVPSGSLIARLFSNASATPTSSSSSGVESLSIWKHSDGSDLGTRDVWIAANRVGSRILAIVKPYG